MRFSALAIILALSPVQTFAETQKRVDHLPPSLVKEQRPDRCVFMSKKLLHDCVKRDLVTGNRQNDSSVQTGRDTRQRVDRFEANPNRQDNMDRSDRIERQGRIFAELKPADKPPMKPVKPDLKPVKPDQTDPMPPRKPETPLPGQPSKPQIPLKPVPGQK